MSQLPLVEKRIEGKQEIDPERVLEARTEGDRKRERQRKRENVQG